MGYGGQVFPGFSVLRENPVHSHYERRSCSIETHHERRQVNLNDMTRAENTSAQFYDSAIVVCVTRDECERFSSDDKREFAESPMKFFCDFSPRVSYG